MLMNRYRWSVKHRNIYNSLHKNTLTIQIKCYCIVYCIARTVFSALNPTAYMCNLELYMSVHASNGTKWLWFIKDSTHSVYSCSQPATPKLKDTRQLIRTRRCPSAQHQTRINCSKKWQFYYFHLPRSKHPNDLTFSTCTMCVVLRVSNNATLHTQCNAASMFQNLCYTAQWRIKFLSRLEVWTTPVVMILNIDTKYL